MQNDEPRHACFQWISAIRTPSSLINVILCPVNNITAIFNQELLGELLKRYKTVEDLHVTIQYEAVASNISRHV